MTDSDLGASDFSDQTSIDASTVLYLLSATTRVHLGFPDGREFPVDVLRVESPRLSVRGAQLPAVAPDTSLWVRFAISGDASYRLQASVIETIPSPTLTQLDLQLPDQAERYEMRSHRRRQVRIVGRLSRAEEFESPPRWHTAHVRDVSPVGAGVLCDAPLERHEVVLFDAPLHDETLTCQARVVRIEASDPFTRYGLEFVRLEEQDRALLERFVSDSA